MKIAAIRERVKGENRVAITPEGAQLYVKKGFRVFVERGIGLGAYYPDSDYENAGASVSPVLLEILSDADVILKVQPTPLVDQFNEIDMAKEGALIIGLLSSHLNYGYINKAASKKLTTIAMELIPTAPHTARMDSLSSQINIAGYRAVIEASYHYARGLPMMMMSCGTINPAKILIIGIKAAGLQAIATAKRLGSVVYAYDNSISTKEQAEVLGATFLYPNEINSSGEKTIYIGEVTQDFALCQQKYLNQIIDKFDIVINTEVSDKKAPLVITKEMMMRMRSGSVIIDITAPVSENTDDLHLNKITLKNGVKIIAGNNLASNIASDSSLLYASSLYNFLDYVIQDNKINFNSEYLRQMVLTYDGNIINKRFKQ